MVVRKVLSCSVPGSTPQKRPAPDSAVDGQISEPGNSAGAPAVPPPRKKPRGSKAAAKSKKDSSTSPGDSSSSSSDGGESAPLVVDLASPAPLACIPAALERGPAFDANQKSSEGKSQRRENPARVAFPHRLTFAI
jgi:hypothetical protein